MLHSSENSPINSILVPINKTDIHTKDNYDNTPLHLAQNAEIAQLLLEHGADVKAKNKDGNTPLHLAQNPEIARLLLKNGANPNEKNRFGGTPLHCVKNQETAAVLLAAGGKVNQIDDKGNTPLHCVRTKKIAKLLVKYGADIEAFNKNNLTVDAVAFHNSTIIDLAIEDEEYTDGYNYHGYGSSKEDYYDAARYLLELKSAK